MGTHGICHVEWACTDLERTKAFLWGLFGWEFQPFGDDYMVFSTPDGPGGGLWKVPEVRAGESPTVYVAVDSLEPYLEEAAELGGSAVKPRTEVPELGWYALIADPDGNRIGLFEAKR